MPYLKQEDRARLDRPITALVDVILFLSEVNEVGVAGQVNYIIARLFNSLWRGTKANYAGLNELIGAIECAKLEIYRRLAARYEDAAVKRNGDVF